MTVSSPQQTRLDMNVPPPTIYQAAKPSMMAMSDQWKTGSMYITSPPSGLDLPNKTPVEYTPGSTAHGTRAFHPLEESLPYGKTVVGKPAIWPPTINQTSNFKLASYPPPAYAGAHLKRVNLCAGLGGIDPTM